jgi:predicted CoA-binding protein
MVIAKEREILERARVIAVVGCSEKPYRDSYRIALYLRNNGYRVYAVNPTIDSVFGERSYPSVASIPEPVDIVDVFRNPVHVMPIVDDAIAAGSKAIWFQLGVVNRSAIERAERAGLDVVVDRCIAVDHRIFGVTPHSTLDNPQS